ncbi:MAG TPA: TlpA disulfide reductase family protein [Ilumatobacteraceae bacterium]|nr:TlpA disulfide reductase family protein [Ilumatobacteraceae bacterium]
MRSRPACIAAATLVLALAACGGDDDDATSATTTPTPAATAPSTTEAATDAPGTTAGETSPSEAGDGPNATVSPDLPDVYQGEVGPVEIQGDSLPELPDSSGDNDPAKGLAAPVVIGEDFDGNTVRIDAANDGVTLVVFLAHWCPHCNREVPHINELRDAGAFPEDLNIIGVSTGISPDRPNWPPSEWFEDMDWTYPVIADGVDMERQTFIAADAYGLTSFPFMTLIDADGKVLARWSGEMEKEDLLQKIEDNLPT